VQEGQNFQQLPELPADLWAETSNSQNFQLAKFDKEQLSVREVILCLSFDFIFMLEHSIFLRPLKLASLFIV
jgi:hypothetical protein